MTSPREHDLAFTIRDRTGTDYSFSERSNGLRYFLSYHVQLLAHQPPKDKQSEILLMDEPDAYLSNQGQQDLLRILERFSRPEDGSRQNQIVYVTHSPFLVNRNAGERVRVLDKGVMDEGTRVVKDVVRNHYEPLRSSLGVFVAETSFIGGANLFVEGLADQVLLAGLNSHLVAIGAPRTTVLDLNDLTIVPAGSASSIPYLVYLARGRDVVRPPCVVLLDSDEAGDEAAKTLAKGGPRRKRLVPKESVIQIGPWVESYAVRVDEGVVVKELEDLIPIPLAVQATRNYATKVVGLTCGDARELVETDIIEQLAAQHGSVFDSVSCAVSRRFGLEVHIEKVGFAREVIAAVGLSRNPSERVAGVDDLTARFRPLLEHLTQCLRAAHRAEQERRWSNRLSRMVNGFLSDYPTTTTRERGKLFSEEVEAIVDSTAEGDQLKAFAVALRRDFNLDEDLLEPIESYEAFLDRVRAFRYAERLERQRIEYRGSQAASQEVRATASDSDEDASVADNASTNTKGSGTGSAAATSESPVAKT